MTDHGVMFGALGFYEAAHAHGIKPILGVEAYVAPGSRFDREPGENEEKYHHLTLLARDETGIPQPAAARIGGAPRGFLLPPPHGQATAGRARRGADLPVGLLVVGAVEAAPRRTGGPSSGGGGRVSGHLRRRRLLDRAPGPRAGRAEAGDAPSRWRSRASSASASSRRTICTTRLPPTPSRTTCCSASSSRSCRRTRSGCGSTPRSSISSPPEQMRALFAELPEACDNTLTIAEMVDLDDLGTPRRSRSVSPPALRGPGWAVARGYLASWSVAGADRALRRPSRRRSGIGSTTR